MQFFDWCVNHWAFCAFVIAMFVQITPVIKFNPFTAVFSWAGKIIVSDVKNDVEEMKALQQEQQNAIDENEKDRIRWEVLDFANSCRNGMNHTKDEFQHIILLNDKYKRLLEKTHDSNGVFTAEYQYILKQYTDKQERNDFL